MQKLKTFLADKVNRAKVVGTMAIVPLTVGAGTLISNAEETATGATDVNSIMTSTATSVSGNIISMIGSIAPIAGTVVAAVLAVTFGFKLIKRFMKG